MIWFIVAYLALTLLLNLYVFRRLKAGLRWHGHRAAGLAFFQCAMVGLLFASHFLRNHDGIVPVRWLMLIAFSWLSAMMWILGLGLVADLWNLGVACAALRKPARRRWVVSPALYIRTLAVSLVVMLIWGVIEAGQISLQTVDIRSPHWPANATPLRIVHLSDLHLGPLVGQQRIWNRMMRLIDTADPDLIVATGDFIDAPPGDLTAFMKEFQALDPPLGKFAVLGNHEYHVGEALSVALLEGFGFALLRGDHRMLSHRGTPVRIAGVDDITGRFMGETCRHAEEDALPADPARPWTVLLKHQPHVNRAVTDRFDLQLSGHLHGGQIFPFHILVRAIYQAWVGVEHVDEATWLYTSPGIGTWGPPLRILAPPRVALIIVRGQGTTTEQSTGAYLLPFRAKALGLAPCLLARQGPIDECE